MNTNTLSNLEAEQALLGALLYNNNAYEKINDFLRPYHFADSRHALIYEYIVHFLERNQIADVLTLAKYADNKLAEIGGVEYIKSLLANVVSILNIEDYGKIVYDLFLRRKLVEIGQGVLKDTSDFGIGNSAKNCIEELEKKIFDLANTEQSNNAIESLGDALIKAINKAEKAFKHSSRIAGVTTGLKDLDKWLGGLNNSDLLILAARPSMGKTALASNIAFNAASTAIDQGGGPVAFFSLEMSSEQLAMRILAHESGIPSHRIRRGELTQNDFPKFIEVSSRIGNTPLFIDDTPALTMSAIRTRSRRIKRQHGLSLIVVDYLQLIQNTRSDNRNLELSEITRSLKALAKELDIPVIALSQLSRAVEQRDDKKPQLSDLRESGAIEQDADVVLFIYREEYYLARKEPSIDSPKHAEWQKKMEEVYNVAEIMVAKQRNGPVGIVRLRYDGNLTKFSNLAF